MVRASKLAPALLVVDEADRAFAAEISYRFERLGWLVRLCATYDEAKTETQAHVDAILVGVVAQDAAAAEVLREIRVARRGPQIVAVLDTVSVPTAVAVVRVGAADVLVKPVTAEDILAALEAHRLRRQREDVRLGVVTDNAIEDVLADCGGDLTAAAARLGVTRRCLELRRKKRPTSTHPRKTREGRPKHKELASR